MQKRHPKWTVSPLETFPKVLVFGRENDLVRQVVRTLEKRGCCVFFRQDKIDDTPQVDYIFQFDKHKKTRLILEKAIIDHARYLLVEENINPDENKEAEEVVFSFKKEVDGRILRIDKVTLSNLSAITNRILKAMFSRKKPLLSTSFKKSLPKKRKKGRKVPFSLSWPKLRVNAFLFTFFLGLLILFVPYLFFGTNFYFGVKKLNAFEKKFFAGDLASSQADVEEAENYFSRAQKVDFFLPLLKDGGRIAFLGEVLSQIGRSSIDLSIIGQRIARLVLDQEKGVLEERFDQLKLEVESLERQISLAEALSQDLSLESLPDISLFSLDEKIKKVANFLNLGKEGCLMIKKTMPLAKEVFGLTEDRKERVYLILFQNNMELRPGGGFIGSYGLVHFKKGVLTDFKTYDVYTADGQLRGHVEPPVAIREYLNQPHFFLRDSNFSPDFAVNGKKAAWFLKKEMGEEVDGVVAIDLSLVQKFLEALGGVYLPDYEQQITSENLFLKAQVLIQAGFFPGSTQKKDFLGALAQGLFNQVKFGQFPGFKMAQALKEALEEKHLHFFLFNSKTQELVEELGWGGRVSMINCQSSMANCFPDYLMIVEANLGVNKANYFVKREVGLESEFGDNHVSHNLILSYRNESPGQTFPGGVYKNYLRIFVPKGAVLEKVLIEGQELPLTNIETEEEEDKQSWGFLVEILPLTRKKVELSYRLERQGTFDATLYSYEFLCQKQAGTEKDPLLLKFRFPKAWQVRKINFPAPIQDGALEYNSDLSVDRIFSIGFLR